MPQSTRFVYGGGRSLCHLGLAPTGALWFRGYVREPGVPIRMMMPLAAAIASTLFCLLAAPANAQTIRACAGVEVRSTEVSVDNARRALLHDKQAKIEILAAQVPATTEDPTIMVVALGPVLGSMDSSEVSTQLACSERGIVLTATITRSADYHGATAKNILWNPKITMVFRLHQPEIVLQTTWRMRLTTGAELDHARTPPYPEQEYPITVTKTVRSASRQEQ